jgi:2-iminoacetate synthase ThiH
MKKDEDTINILNKSLRVFFKDALRITLKNPIQAYFFFRTIQWQRKTARARTKWTRQGVPVPPIIIFSITNACNLQCKGYYAQALERSPQAEMSEVKIRSIIEEAKELGVSFFVLAGGEPFVRQQILIPSQMVNL